MSRVKFQNFGNGNRDFIPSFVTRYTIDMGKGGIKAVLEISMRWRDRSYIYFHRHRKEEADGFGLLKKRQRTDLKKYQAGSREPT